MFLTSQMGSAAQPYLGSYWRDRRTEEFKGTFVCDHSGQKKCLEKCNLLTFTFLIPEHNLNFLFYHAE